MSIVKILLQAQRIVSGWRGHGAGALGRAFLAVAVIGLAACASGGPYWIELMPAPEVYDDESINPFTDKDPIENIPYAGVLYATDRAPAEEGAKEHYYLNKRGHVLRLGTAQVALGDHPVTWEEARRISLLKNRADTYPLKVSEVEEFGILDRSHTVFTKAELTGPPSVEPARRFVAKVNKKLAISKRKDVYVYVHGYKVVFENPVLVASEIWHFLGYEGVFVAYAWPATPSKWAYFSDLETTTASARNFRLLLEFLAEETEAERIHIIGYSAGTRLVTRALEQLALQHHDETPTEVRRRLRIGNVILVGSDVDRQLFGTYLADGLLKVPRHLSIYVSNTDKALGLSRWLFTRDRLGQMWAEGTLTPVAAEYLWNTKNLSVINVTEAEGSASGNGHAYFRKSPWGSSDILATLLYDLGPDQRGLERSQARPIWRFPPDYIERLRSALLEANPSWRQTP